ncbi:MAG: 5-formyltetrahydrofolate cyclo-ligase [Cocleimonas sp.]
MKDQTRQRLRTERAELSLELFTSMSSTIAQNVRDSEVFKNAKRIGFYHSVRGEADPASLQTSDKHFFLPVLSKNLNEGLVFIELNTDTEFENNKFAIPEPVYDEAKIVAANTLDLVLVPLLGFDKNGNRLGMGGGFYDRCFAFRKQQNTKPLLMGYAYDFQEVDSLEPESWDVGLDMIATESGLINPDSV